MRKEINLNTVHLRSTHFRPHIVGLTINNRGFEIRVYDETRAEESVAGSITVSEVDGGDVYLEDIYVFTWYRFEGVCKAALANLADWYYPAKVTCIAETSEENAICEGCAMELLNVLSDDERAKEYKLTGWRESIMRKKVNFNRPVAVTWGNTYVHRETGYPVNVRAIEVDGKHVGEVSVLLTPDGERNWLWDGQIFPEFRGHALFERALRSVHEDFGILLARDLPEDRDYLRHKGKETRAQYPGIREMRVAWEI